MQNGDTQCPQILLHKKGDELRDGLKGDTMEREEEEREMMEERYWMGCWR